MLTVKTKLKQLKPILNLEIADQLSWKTVYVWIPVSPPGSTSLLNKSKDKFLNIWFKVLQRLANYCLWVSMHIFTHTLKTEYPSTAKMSSSYKFISKRLNNPLYSSKPKIIPIWFVVLFSKSLQRLFTLCSKVKSTVPRVSHWPDCFQFGDWNFMAYFWELPTNHCTFSFLIGKRGKTHCSLMPAWWL